MTTDTIVNSVTPEGALIHLDVIYSRIRGGDERFDAERKESIQLSKHAINHCMIATDVKLDDCDEKTHFKCPNCNTILHTTWKDTPVTSTGEKSAFCKRCGKKLNWDNVMK